MTSEEVGQDHEFASRGEMYNGMVCISQLENVSPYSGTSLIRTPMGQNKLSSFQRLKCIQEWVLGVGKSCPV